MISSETNLLSIEYISAILAASKSYNELTAVHREFEKLARRVHVVEQGFAQFEIGLAKLMAVSGDEHMITAA